MNGCTIQIIRHKIVRNKNVVSKLAVHQILFFVPNYFFIILALYVTRDLNQRFVREGFLAKRFLQPIFSPLRNVSHNLRFFSDDVRD